MTVFLLAIFPLSQFEVISHSYGREAPATETQASLVSTAMLPCVAQEYGHTWCVASTRRRATSGSTPGRLILRRDVVGVAVRAEVDLGVDRQIGR
jgi:hypothetical protein